MLLLTESTAVSTCQLEHILELEVLASEDSSMMDEVTNRIAESGATIKVHLTPVIAVTSIDMW
jgi:hypothetical protein